jgi:hypothetical protein
MAGAAVITPSAEPPLWSARAAYSAPSRAFRHKPRVFRNAFGVALANCLGFVPVFGRNPGQFAVARGDLHATRHRPPGHPSPPP